MSANVSYAALTRDEKKDLARELRPTSTLREIADQLGVGVKAVWAWTKDLGRPVPEPMQSRPTPPAQTCHCTAPAADPKRDAHCRRPETCIYCGWPAQKPGGDR